MSDIPRTPRLTQASPKVVALEYLTFLFLLGTYSEYLFLWWGAPRP